MTTGLVLAHGLGGRSDLPVPLWMALYGGAAAVVVSFVALGALWTTPRLDTPGGLPLPGWVGRVVDAPATRRALRGLAVLLLLATVVVAALGPTSPTANPATAWLYVWFWVGLVPLSLLFGPVWRVVNPLRAVTRLALYLYAGDPHEVRRRPLPGRLGSWPAAVSLLIFLWVELVYGAGDSPRTVLWFVLAYAVVHVTAGAIYGTRWFGRADGFEVYSTLIGHLAPLGRDAEGRLVLRNPLRGLASLRPDTSLVAVIVILLGSTAFDGLTRTAWWEELTAGPTDLRYHLLGTVGLASAVAAVAATYAGAIRLAALTGRRTAPVRGLGQRFAHSLVPIALGYTVAHYFSLMVFEGQFGYLAASDPLGRGWDLFGTADWRIAYTAVSTRTIAIVQVAAIVVGHVLGVVAAHDRAVATFDGIDRTRSQYPLLALMVVYTIGGIALLVGA